MPVRPGDDGSMTLYPAARRAVAALEAEPRIADTDIVAFREAARIEALKAPRDEIWRVEDVDAAGVHCRLYTPVGAGDGLIVHVHGGGFVFNDVEVHDPICRRFANRAGLPVLSVDYRRPPEHRFPAAPDDVDQAVAWARAQGVPLFIHGDSDGGNLALVAALRNPGTFAAVALVYPFLDPTASGPSYGEAGWSREEALWYWEQYAASAADLSNPDLAPLLSDRLGTLPPLLVITAEHDIVRDEGERLAAQVAGLGVEVVGSRCLGQTHAFWRHPDVFPASESVLDQVSGFFRRRL